MEGRRKERRPEKREVKGNKKNSEDEEQSDNGCSGAAVQWEAAWGFKDEEEVKKTNESWDEGAERYWLREPGRSTYSLPIKQTQLLKRYLIHFPITGFCARPYRGEPGALQYLKETQYTWCRRAVQNSRKSQVRRQLPQWASSICLLKAFPRRRQRKHLHDYAPAASSVDTGQE